MVPVRMACTLLLPVIMGYMLLLLVGVVWQSGLPQGLACGFTLLVGTASWWIPLPGMGCMSLVPSVGLTMAVAKRATRILPCLTPEKCVPKLDSPPQPTTMLS